MKTHFVFPVIFSLLLIVSVQVFAQDEELITNLSNNTGLMVSGGVVFKDFSIITNLASDQSTSSNLTMYSSASLGWRVHFGKLLMGVGFERGSAQFNPSQNTQVGYNDLSFTVDFGFDLAKSAHWRVVPNIGAGISEADIHYTVKQPSAAVSQHFNIANATALSLIRAQAKLGLLVLTKVSRNPDSPYYNFELGLDTEFEKPFGKSSWQDAFGDEITGPNLNESAASIRLVLSYWF